MSIPSPKLQPGFVARHLSICCLQDGLGSVSLPLREVWFAVGPYWITHPSPSIWIKPTHLPQPLLLACTFCPSCLSSPLTGPAHTEGSKATQNITGGLCGTEASLSLPATCLLLQSARHFVMLAMPAHAGLKQGVTCNYSNMKSSRGLIHCTGDSTVSKQFQNPIS